MFVACCGREPWAVRLSVLAWASVLVSRPVRSVPFSLHSFVKAYSIEVEIEIEVEAPAVLV